MSSFTYPSWEPRFVITGENGGLSTCNKLCIQDLYSRLSGIPFDDVKRNYSTHKLIESLKKHGYQVSIEE